MTRPLTLRIPVTGPSGERDNIERLCLTMADLMPRGRVFAVDVAHDAGCPCETGDRGMPACTCEAVDVTLRISEAAAVA